MGLRDRCKNYAKGDEPFALLSKKTVMPVENFRDNCSPDFRYFSTENRFSKTLLIGHSPIYHV